VPIAPDSGKVIEILHEPASGVVTSAPDARVESARARHPDEIAISEFWSTDKARSAATRTASGGGSGATPAPETRTIEIDLADAGGVDVTAAREDERPVAEDRARPSTDAELEAALRPRRWPILLLVLILLGAGGFLAYRFLGPFVVNNGHAAATRVGGGAVSAPTEPVAPVAPAEPPIAPPLTVDASGAVDLARAALRRDLAATSPRVRRLAAAALARTQDPAACDLIAAQIGLTAAPPARAAGEPDELAIGDIARLDLAYALARGGDRRGRDVLAASLTASRGEARDEAARLLALLGDRRAVPHLLDLLAVEQRRLGAAEHLAHLAEPRAVKVLDQVRGDPRASADDKARATVALGIAGRSDVAGALRAMLGDPHFNAFAAAALAAQGDRAAQPVLEHQLASPPLRVLAARALRRLDPSLDARPLLPPLLDVVRTGRDVDHIPAAEAILLLAGPEGWSALQ
jgi:HEAT repeat protein